MKRIDKHGDSLDEVLPSMVVEGVYMTKQVVGTLQSETDSLKAAMVIDPKIVMGLDGNMRLDGDGYDVIRSMDDVGRGCYEGVDLMNNHMGNMCSSHNDLGMAQPSVNHVYFGVDCFRVRCVGASANSRCNSTSEYTLE